MKHYEDREGPVPLTVCAVCGRVLDYNQILEAFEHSLQDREREDHPPVPVAAGELADHHARCDFCNADVPTAAMWAVPAEDFEMPLPPHVSAGDWAACPECAVLIGRGRWTQLISRVLRESPSARAGLIDRRLLVALYQRLAAHMTGPPYREPSRRTQV